MSARSWAGLVLAASVFGLFGYFIRVQGCQLTTLWGAAFGGGLLFCGILIDPAEFKSVLSLVLPFARKGP